MKRMIIIGAMLLAFSGLASAEQTVTIDASCLTLADLAPGAEEGVNLACGFFMGDEKRFPASRVKSVLTHYGVNRPAEDLVVKRMGMELAEEQVRERITAIFAERYPDMRFEFEKVHLPKRTFVKSLDSYTIDLPEHEFGSVHGSINNGETTEPVYIYVKAYADGFVTTHTVRSGEPLAGSFEAREVEVTNLRGALVDTPQAFIADRTIPRGRTIITADVMDRPDQFEGDTVKLVYTADAMRIEARGRLMEDAYTGKIVRVENVMTGKIVSAKYAGDKVAIASF